MPIRRSPFQVIAESAKRAVRTEPKVSKPEASPANAATPEPSVASSADSPSQSRNKTTTTTTTTTVNKTPIRTPQSVRRRKRPPASTGKSIKPNAYELVAAAQASPAGARKHAVKHSLRHSPLTTVVAPKLNHAKPAPKVAADSGKVDEKISEAQVTPNKDVQPLTNDFGSRTADMAESFVQGSASECLQEGAPKAPTPSKPQTSPAAEHSGTNSDAPSKMNHNITTDEVKADHAKPASTSSAVSVTMRGNDTQQKQDKEQQPLTNDNGSELLISEAAIAEPISQAPASKPLYEGRTAKPLLPSMPQTRPVAEPSPTNDDELSNGMNKIPTDELVLSQDNGTESLDPSSLNALLPESNSPESHTSAAVEPVRPSADETSPSTDKVGNTELNRKPKKGEQPKEHGRSAFDCVDPLEHNVTGGTQVTKLPSPDMAIQSSSSPKPATTPRRELDETSPPAKSKKSPTELKRTPQSELKLINPSSPEALVAMAEALELSQTQMRLASATGASQPSYPDRHTDNAPLSRNPKPGYQHRTVDLGSLHGNSFTAFLISNLCEIIQFLYTSTPSTPLRLINLVLAVSLYSGVFDTHVQRAPLGMMLNRLAAWIVALLALSTSIYTTPGEQWKTGEVLLVNMFGTLLFPLATLDSISVLWAEIRCRNFILNGFATENLYIYVLLLVTPMIRFLLTYEEAADLYMSYPLAETIYIVSVFSALIVAMEYYCACQVAAGNFSKDIWQGMASILWGFLHAPGCAILVGWLNGINAGGYFYVGCFFVFVGGKALEVILQTTGGIQYRDTSTAPPMAAKKL